MPRLATEMDADIQESGRRGLLQHCVVSRLNQGSQAADRDEGGQGA